MKRSCPHLENKPISARVIASPRPSISIKMQPYLIVTPLCFLSLIVSAAAEVFVMKDGSKLEGSILRENATSYVIEVKVTKSIKDEREIAKADIEKIERVPPDKLAFAVIEKLTPTPDLLTSDAYAKRIRAVEQFLTNHRLSAKLKDAKEILATLKSEANEILAGGIKLNGKIIPAAEYQANAYDIDARMQEANLRKLARDLKYLQTLRTFTNFERNFRNTLSYRALVPLMNQVMTSHLAEANQFLSTYETREQERKLGLERMPRAERRATVNAIREENAALEAQFTKEKDARLGWVSIHPFCKSALDETVAFGQQEIARLAATRDEPVVDGGKIFRDAMSLIRSEGEAAEIAAAITAAKTATLPARYIAILESAAPEVKTDP